MVPLLLLLLLVTYGQSCKEVSPDCEKQVLAEETNLTIDQVIADINETLKEASEFYVKYETNLHTFSVQLESRLRADKIMLERLVKLQERHGSRFPSTSEFEEICDEHLTKKCPVTFNLFVDETWTTNNVVVKPIIQNETELTCPTLTGRSSAPLTLHYKNEKGGMQNTEDKFECLNGTWNTADGKISNGNDIAQSKSFVCGIEKSQVCESIASSVNKCENCTVPLYDPATLIHTCITGYAFNITEETRQVRCEFVDNRVELVYEGNTTSGKYDGELVCYQIPSQQELREPCPYTCAETAQCSESKLVCTCLKGYADVSSKYGKDPGSICTKCKSFEQGTDYVMNDIVSSVREIKERDWTNTPYAMRSANDKIYATMGSNSTRPRVTVLFTDGAPNICYSNSERQDKDCIYSDLQRESMKMRDAYKAQIFSVYVGRELGEDDVKSMRAITSEDEEITVDSFDEMKELAVLDQLQTKFC